MFSWIISSSILILLVMFLRIIVKDRVSPRLRYALWLLVLLRLLIPGNLGSTPLSVLNAFQPTKNVTTQVPAANLNDTAANLTVPAGEDTIPGAEQQFQQTQQTQPLPQAPQVIPTGAGTATGKQVDVLLAVWVAGVLLMALFLLVANLRFYMTLRRSRVPEGKYETLPVYVANGISSPCLVGLVRPAIYMPTELMHSKEAGIHIMAHEYAHYRQGDHIWTALRSVCLALHWFNPLVWWAASQSKQDCELSCDAGAVGVLGEDARIPYGETLVSLVIRTRVNVLPFATTMVGKKSAIKERVAMLARNPKNTTAMLCAVLALATLFTACTFTGPAPTKEPIDPIGIIVEPGYPYGNMQKNLPAGNYIRYEDTVLFFHLGDRGYKLLFSYDMETGEVSLFCQDATCSHSTSDCPSRSVDMNLELYNGKIYALKSRSSYNHILKELKNGHFEEVMDGGTQYWHGNGNLYVITPDGALMVAENGSTKLRMILEEFYGFWDVVFGQYLYYIGHNFDVARLDLRAEKPQEEIIMQGATIAALYDGWHIYYVDEADSWRLYRCNMDGSDPVMLLDKQVLPVSINFDDTYFYFRLRTDDQNDPNSHDIYRMSKSDPTQVVKIAELPEPAHQVFTVPGYDKVFVTTESETGDASIYTVAIDGSGYEELVIPEF